MEQRERERGRKREKWRSKLLVDPGQFKAGWMLLCPSIIAVIMGIMTSLDRFLGCLKQPSPVKSRAFRLESRLHRYSH